MHSIGIIGLGNIGGALARGLHAALPGLGIFATTRSGAPLPAFVSSCASNAELVARTHTVLLCVKPRHARAVLREIAPVIGRKHRIVSTCAAITLAALQAELPDVPVARAMPNLPCEFGAGITALAFADSWPQEERDRLLRLFASLGETLCVEERAFDAVTALSGCGPAYVCLALEALSDAGVKAGLPRSAAAALAVQTVLGSALLVKRTNEHPALIRERVATPGGCTIDALALLEERGFRAALIAAVGVAAEKSAALRDLRSERPASDVPPRAVDGGALTA